jgi:RNA-binding protein
MNYANKTEKELKEIAKTLQPCLRLGKSGITAGVVEEINLHLKKDKLVKLKLLPAFFDYVDKRDAGEVLAHKTHSELILQVGGSVVLFRR